MGRFLICCAMALALAGCNAYNATTKALSPSAGVVAGLIVLDGASVINTQKTIDDHFVSLVTGMDCSTVRASQGGHYCVEETETGPVAIRTTYCYKSLAKVTCYDQPLNRDASQLYGIRVDRIPVADDMPLPPPIPVAATVAAPVVAVAAPPPPPAPDATTPAVPPNTPVRITPLP